MHDLTLPPASHEVPSPVLHGHKPASSEVPHYCHKSRRPIPAQFSQLCPRAVTPLAGEQVDRGRAQFWPSAQNISLCHKTARVPSTRRAFSNSPQCCLFGSCMMKPENLKKFSSPGGRGWRRPGSADRPTPPLPRTIPTPILFQAMAEPPFLLCSSK